MTLSMLSTLRSAMTTATIMIVVVNVIIGGSTNNKSLFANAQLFTSCSDEVTDDGTAYELCVVNTPSPVTLELIDGTFQSFGTESVILISCVTGFAYSVDSCACDFIVNPSDPVAATDFCTSCTVAAISDTTFTPHFDCSNRLVGDCVGFEETTGVCIDNSGGTVPAPVQTPVAVPVGTTIPPPAPAAVPVPTPLSSVEVNNTMDGTDRGTPTSSAVTNSFSMLLGVPAFLCSVGITIVMG